MKPKTDISNHLKRYRLLSGGMTQQELADRASVTRQTILSIEKGRYNPTIGLALRLAVIFGVPAEALFMLEEGENDG
jgi:putative transcriptional regulator